MTNDEMIQALIKAGDKATQGEFKHSREDMLSFNGHTGKQESFVYPPEPNERICVSTELPVEDARFFAQAANSREVIREMYEENKRLRKALKMFLDDMKDDSIENFTINLARQALEGTDNE